jgi:hypothetical protein
MNYCGSFGVVAFSEALLMEIGSATARDETKYPDLRGNEWQSAAQ